MNTVESKSTLDVHALGQGRLDLLHALAHGGGDGDRVGALLLQDAHRLDGHPVETRYRGRVLEAVLDHPDVLEMNGGRAGVAFPSWVGGRRLALLDDELAGTCRYRAPRRETDIEIARPP